jgi:hypothetical protein
MALTPGARLGPYEITASIGKGLVRLAAAQEATP